jgi:hypothetical protein
MPQEWAVVAEAFPSIRAMTGFPSWIAQQISTPLSIDG